jgi:hypothetical protein
MAVDAVGLDRRTSPAKRRVQVHVGTEHQLAGIGRAAALAAVERGGRFAGVGELRSEDVARVGGCGQ